MQDQTRREADEAQTCDCDNFLSLIMPQKKKKEKKNPALPSLLAAQINNKALML